MDDKGQIITILILVLAFLLAVGYVVLTMR